jgi:hypothetical protein
MVGDLIIVSAARGFEYVRLAVMFRIPTYQYLYLCPPYRLPPPSQRQMLALALADYSTRSQVSKREKAKNE